MKLVDSTSIAAAADRIAGSVVRTPLLPSFLGEADRELLLKPENLQPIGAFKLRGAVNAIRSLDRPNGVVAYSSGNHAQAVAYAAKLAGLPAVIVIEETAPARKIEATRSHGAEVVLTDPEERESTAHRLAAEREYPLIAPFDDPAVIAGQGTIGSEIAEDAPDIAAVLVPISGGGLASGIAAAIKAHRPKALVYGVEPELAADTRESLEAGVIREWSRAERGRTIADGLRSTPSELTFAHLRAHLDGVLTVTEEQITGTVRRLALEARLIAEPSGAVAPAAFLHHGAALPQGRIAAVVSGGNINPVLLGRLLTDTHAR
ncbi:threonine ammonia-lyase [Sciscionella marina]|uniref:threonine ammonia-lyase n=1 Tax=Sciscionella marina TaxID=508770 RepID=UPI00036CD303|nr:threonine/serine dehydratase [Sciscionella marina]